MLGVKEIPHGDPLALELRVAAIPSCIRAIEYAIKAQPRARLPLRSLVRVSQRSKERVSRSRRSASGSDSSGSSKTPVGGRNVFIKAAKRSTSRSRWSKHCGLMRPGIAFWPGETPVASMCWSWPEPWTARTTSNAHRAGLHGCDENSGKAFFAPADVCVGSRRAGGGLTIPIGRVHHLSLGKDATTNQLRTGAFHETWANRFCSLAEKPIKRKLCVIDASASHRRYLRVVRPVEGGCNRSHADRDPFSEIRPAGVLNVRRSSESPDSIQLWNSARLDPNGDKDSRRAPGSPDRCRPWKKSVPCGASRRGDVLPGVRQLALTNPGDGCLDQSSLSIIRVGKVPSRRQPRRD